MLGIVRDRPDVGFHGGLDFRETGNDVLDLLDRAKGGAVAASEHQGGDDRDMTKLWRAKEFRETGPPERASVLLFLP